MFLQLKKTRLMRYSMPVHSCNLFINKFPIKTNLIYVKDFDLHKSEQKGRSRRDPDFIRACPDLCSGLYKTERQDHVNSRNINNLLKYPKKEKLCNKNTNTINKFDIHTKFKYYTVIGISGSLILTFFYSYYNYYENAVNSLTMPK